MASATEASFTLIEPHVTTALGFTPFPETDSGITLSTYLGTAQELLVYTGLEGLKGAQVDLCTCAFEPSFPANTVDPPIPFDFYAREFMSPTNLSMIRGDYRQFTFQVVSEDTGEPMNITGGIVRFTAKYPVNVEPNGSAIISLSSSGSGVSLTNPAIGKFVVTISPINTSSLKMTNKLPLDFDIEYTDLDGNPKTVVFGTLTIFPDIT